MLMRLLQLKFGDLSEEVRMRVERADESSLLEWSARVLTAESLEEVIR